MFGNLINSIQKPALFNGMILKDLREITLKG
jgi:hypothetical protein